jgi:hypothetical protein
MTYRIDDAMLGRENDMIFGGTFAVEYLLGGRNTRSERRL